MVWALGSKFNVWRHEFDLHSRLAGRSCSKQGLLLYADALGRGGQRMSKSTPD